LSRRALKRLAIIDLGSNTARLVLYEYAPGRYYRLLDELRQVVRLLEGMSSDGQLSEVASARALAAMTLFGDYCQAAQVDEVVAVATSAVRDAENGAALLAEMEAASGIRFSVLSGEDEGRYGALAVVNSFPFDEATTIDLGGGSLQLSRISARQVILGRSWPLGALRTQQRFLQRDPPKKKEVSALIKEVRAQLGELPRYEAPLVAMGGTARNLASVVQREQSYPVDLIHGYALEAAALEALCEKLVALPTAERRKLSGLSRDRADIIHAGALVLREVLRLQGQSRLWISGQGIREGLLYSRLCPEGGVLEGVRRFHVMNLMQHYYPFEAHNRHVAKLALTLFEGLQDRHGFGLLERELLEAACYLHDIGMAVNYFDHHKHGFYLVMAAALPGFSHREQAIIALLVRYHRKGTPQPLGLEGLLEPDDMTRVSWLSGMLRLAEYLERSKTQRVNGVSCRWQGDTLVIRARARSQAALEVALASERSSLLASALGSPLQLQLDTDASAEDGGER
jgi:exopolyphosphatase/guanosine-5'-triphosphate,3'-diphosphate pyrophosphatase